MGVFGQERVDMILRELIFWVRRICFFVCFIDSWIWDIRIVCRIQCLFLVYVIEFFKYGVVCGCRGFFEFMLGVIIIWFLDFCFILFSILSF